MLASFQICGFPLHFAFSDQKEILEAVSATGVHLNEEPGVEFALAVHVEPYPCSVMSVWVYVASMLRRR
jgi:coiled-coil and C2 domain-containing protein 2A